MNKNEQSIKNAMKKNKTIRHMGKQYPSYTMGGRPRFTTTMNTNAWVEKYELEIFTTPCTDCGAPITCDMPYWAGTYRGLVAPVCSCGHDQGVHIAVDTDYGPEGLNSLAGISEPPRPDFGRLLNAVPEQQDGGTE